MRNTGRKLKYGINSAILIAAMVAIIVMVYYISTRHPVQHDFTKGKINTLSVETIRMTRQLNKMRKPVIATVFLQDGSYEQTRVRDLFTQLNSRTRYFQFRVVDPQREPGSFRALNMDGLGVVFESGQPNTPQYRKKIVYKEEMFTSDPMTGASAFNGEQSVLNALLAVAMKTNIMICFLQGHEESSIEVREDPGISKLSDRLEAEAYQLNVAELKPGGIPEGCRVLIMDSPKTPVYKDERKVLEDYLARGGSLMLLMDADYSPGLEGVLGRWGIEAARNAVRDPERKLDADGFNILPRFLEHTSTQGLDEKKQAINLLLAMSLKINKKKIAKDVMVSPLLETSPQAEAGQLLQDMSGRGLNFVPVKGKGPFTLAAAVEIKGKKNKKSRVVVVGNGIFISNYFLVAEITIRDNEAQMSKDKSPGNADFVMNCINWLTGEEKLITLRPRTAPQRTLTMDLITRNTIFKLFTFVIPLAILALGGVIWHWRRSL